jgi:hypothetical protein
MSVIDERGRLFGRVNLVDAMVLIVVAGLIPLAYAASVLFRTATPTISALAPKQVVEQTESTIRVTGRDLRAFLNARLGTIPVTFLIQSTTDGELRVPPLAAGNYDLTLLDQGTEVVHVPAALIVIASPTKMAKLRVKFAVLPEAAKLARVGDTDTPTGPTDTGERAVVTEVGSDRQTVRGEVLNLRGLAPAALNRERGMPLQFEQDVVVFTATLRAPLTPTPFGWMYHDRPVKIGAPFTFESASGILEGWVLDVQVPE